MCSPSPPMPRQGQLLRKACIQYNSNRRLNRDVLAPQLSMLLSKLADQGNHHRCNSCTLNCCSLRLYKDIQCMWISPISCAALTVKTSAHMRVSNQATTRVVCPCLCRAATVPDTASPCKAFHTIVESHNHVFTAHQICSDTMCNAESSSLSNC